MKTLACMAIALGTLASPVLSLAQSTAPLTRAEVRAELIRVEKAGYIPSSGDDVNYPADIQAAEAKIAAENNSQTMNDAIGGMPMKGNSAAGAPTQAPKPVASSCVAPVSYCNIYFGNWLPRVATVGMRWTDEVNVTIVFFEDSNPSASGSNVAQGQVNTTPSAPMNAQASDHHGLTRHDVYNQLVQAQKDGTLARLDALYYGPWDGARKQVVVQRASRGLPNIGSRDDPPRHLVN